MRGKRRKPWAFVVGLSLMTAACGSELRELGVTGSALSGASSPPASSPSPSETEEEPSGPETSTPKPSVPPAYCQSPDLPPDAMLLPSYDCTKVFPAPALGPVGIEGDASKGCVWITNGKGTYRQMALWFPGYWARFDPVRIYDPAGRQVWSELDPLREIGVWYAGDSVARIPEECRTGDVVSIIRVLPFWG